MTTDQVMTKVIEMVEAAGGRFKFDAGNREHNEVISGITLKVRSDLARNNGIIVHYDPTTKVPDEVFRHTTGVTAKPVVATPAPIVAPVAPVATPVVKAKAEEIPVVPATPKPVAKPAPVKIQPPAAEHTFFAAPFEDEIVAMLGAGRNWTTEKAVNLLFVGPKGSGKTETVERVATGAGFGRVYQVNGYSEMPAASFLGDKTVAVDPKSMQSYVTYQQGILERAMVHGCELDADGRVVFDDNGNVKVTGAPAMLFVDEFGGLDERISFVLNRAMQIPRKPGLSRVIELDTDGGRLVKSHPGFCVVMAGNVIGRGTNASESEAQYTAQDNQHDISFLDRITSTFYFGYNLEAEQQIVRHKLDDDALAAKVLQFRDAIRDAYTKRTVETLLSTRGIVALCDVVRMLKRAGYKDAAARAVYRTLYSSLVETEKGAWNDAVKLAFGIDMIRSYERTTKLWVPRFDA